MTAEDPRWLFLAYKVPSEPSSNRIGIWRELKRLGAYYPSPGFCDERMIFYACTDLVRPSHEVARDPDEELEPRVFTIRQVRRLVERGGIVDMKTVVGLSLLDRT